MKKLILLSILFISACTSFTGSVPSCTGTNRMSDYCDGGSQHSAK